MSVTRDFQFALGHTVLKISLIPSGPGDVTCSSALFRVSRGLIFRLNLVRRQRVLFESNGATRSDTTESLRGYESSRDNMDVGLESGLGPGLEGVLEPVLECDRWSGWHSGIC
jgi:hypothetical protein